LANVLVSVFGKTDLGRTRDHNEDTFLVVGDYTHGVPSIVGRYTFFVANGKKSFVEENFP